MTEKKKKKESGASANSGATSRGKCAVLAVFCVVSIASTSASTQELDAAKILASVESTYKSMRTYASQGTVTVDMEADGNRTKIETEFSIRLKKPNLYRITWTQKTTTGAMTMAMNNSGAIWSDGTERYMYLGMGDTYTAMQSDGIAFASATGVSGGVTATIPPMFLKMDGAFPGLLSRFVNPKLHGTEKVNGEECYVIAASSAASKSEILWVSKKRKLIVKYEHSLERGSGMPKSFEMNDEQLEEALKASGQSVTEDAKKSMREMLKTSQKDTKGLQGTSVELHTKIAMPELKKKDFKFIVPPGVTLRGSDD